MIRTYITSLALIGTVFISGCVSPYILKDAEPRAKIQPMGFGTITFCKNNKAYSLPSDPKNKEVKYIPSGERITIKKSLSFQGYNVTYSCHPELSFVPASNETYIVNADLQGSQCYIELLKLNEEKETGVDIDFTTSSSNCIPETNVPYESNTIKY